MSPPTYRISRYNVTKIQKKNQHFYWKVALIGKMTANTFNIQESWFISCQFLQYFLLLLLDLIGPVTFLQSCQPFVQTLTCRPTPGTRSSGRCRLRSGRSRSRQMAAWWWEASMWMLTGTFRWPPPGRRTSTRTLRTRGCPAKTRRRLDPVLRCFTNWQNTKSSEHDEMSIILETFESL